MQKLDFNKNWFNINNSYWEHIQSSRCPGIKANYKTAYVKTEINKTANPTMLLSVWKDFILYF